MAIPAAFETRKDLPGYGSDGKVYPSVRLWTRTGTLPRWDKNCGLGVKIFTTEDADHSATTDRAKTRMAWRRFAHRPVSYNWHKRWVLLNRNL